MKKTVQLFHILLVSLIVSACDGGGDSGVNPNGNAPNDTERNDQSTPSQEEVSFTFFTSENVQSGSTAVKRLNKTDGTVSVISGDSSNSVAISLPLIFETEVDLTAINIMITNEELFYLDKESGEAELIGTIPASGTLCRNHSWLNNPGSPAPYIAVETSGQDNNCYTYADNDYLAIEVGESYINSHTINEFIFGAEAIQDFQLNKIGYIGVKDGEIAIWDTNFNETALIDTSHYSEEVVVTSPATNGNIFISDHKSIFWGLPTNILSSSESLIPVDTGNFNHIQDEDTVYFITDGRTVKMGNLLNGSTTEITTIESYIASSTHSIKQTQTSIIYVGYHIQNGTRHLMAVDKLTGEVSVIQDLPPIGDIFFEASDLDIYYNDTISTSALCIDDKGNTLETINHAFWLSINEEDLISNSNILLARGVASNGDYISNPQLSTYNPNDLDSNLPLGSIMGEVDFKTVNLINNDVVLISFMHETGNVSKVYQIDLSAADSIIEIQ